jgi:hypothetical protein
MDPLREIRGPRRVIPPRRHPREPPLRVVTILNRISPRACHPLLLALERIFVGRETPVRLLHPRQLPQATIGRVPLSVVAFPNRTFPLIF